MDAERWNEGSTGPGYPAKGVIVTQTQVVDAWATARAAMESRGVRFENHDGSGALKFGGVVTEGVGAFMGTFEAALTKEFGDLTKGVVLVRSAPAALESGYVRARFGFRRDA